VQADALPAPFEDCGDVPSIADTAIVMPVVLGQRDFRGDCDAVISLLAVQDDVAIPECLKCIGRELVVLTLDFLQAENVGLEPT